MTTKVLFLAASLAVLAPDLASAQQKSPEPGKVAQLERFASESDWKARTLSGAPKQKWLLHQRRIENLIEKLKTQQEVDPNEIDQILREHYR